MMPILLPQLRGLHGLIKALDIMAHKGDIANTANRRAKQAALNATCICSSHTQMKRQFLNLQPAVSGGPGWRLDSHCCLQGQPIRLLKRSPLQVSLPLFIPSRDPPPATSVS